MLKPGSADWSSERLDLVGNTMIFNIKRTRCQSRGWTTSDLKRRARRVSDEITSEKVKPPYKALNTNESAPAALLVRRFGFGAILFIR